MSFLIPQKCHYCSRFRPAWEIARIGDGSMRICQQCREHNEQVIRLFAGGKHPGCYGCGLAFEELAVRKAEANGDVKMYLHMRDQIYQLLCDSCSERYIPKRRDLFSPTTFGHRLKLK